MNFLKKINFISSKNSEDSNETLNSEMDLINPETIVKVENENSKVSFFSNVTEKTGLFFSDLGATLNDKYATVSDLTVKNYNDSANRMSSFSDSAINLTSEFKNSLVVFKSDISNKYNQIEIKSNLLKIISTLDCEKIVESLELLKNEHLKKVHLKNEELNNEELNNEELRIRTAFSITQQIILTLDRHNKAIANETSELNKEINSILNYVDIKEVINIVEPFCNLIPYGGIVICIVKLFIK